MIGNVLYADGIPVDSNGIVLVPHFTIKLSDSQKKYLENHREIILTENQKRYFHPRWPIEKLDVVDPHHNDCTCGMIYGIWTSPDELTLLGDTLAMSDSSYYKQPVDPYYREFITESEFNIETNEHYLFIGVKGDIYYKNKKVNETEIKSITEAIFHGESDNFMLVFMPPKINNSNWNLVEESKKLIGKNSKTDIQLVWM